MKLCKKGLHLYDTKQCMVCEKAWRKANKAYIYETNKAWQLANKATYVRKVNKTVAKAWREANRAKRTAAQIKRQADKIQRTPKWLTTLHFQQIEILYKAAQALTKEFGIPMEVDHIVPLKGKNVSGLHVPWNLQVISEKENMSKGNR